MPSVDRLRNDLMTAYARALESVDGRRCVAQELNERPFAGEVYVIAMGKAAVAMADGAYDVLGDAIRDAVVITKHGYEGPLPWPVYTAGHPVPDQDSLAAGEKVLGFMDALPDEAVVLVLLSGGASSLVESLLGNIRLADLQAVNEWMLAAGWDIGQCNRLRRHLSAIKGGGLARHLDGRKALCLTISDVKGNDPAVIASGPLTPPPAGEVSEALPEIPAWIRDLLRAVPAKPAISTETIETRVIATPEQARTAAAQALTAMGYHCMEQIEYLEGDVAEAAGRIAQTMRQTPGTVHVWSGEPTVRLPDAPGRGGRAQQLAVAVAAALGGADFCLLAGATDGSDGPGSDAGALVDGGTLDRGRLHGGDVEAALANADAGTFLELSGDLISTGPTGSNVTDVYLGCVFK